MSDVTIFFVGLFTFLLLSGGLIFTVIEVHNIEKKDLAKREAKLSGSSSS
jgi:hypothetical protein